MLLWDKKVLSDQFLEILPSTAEAVILFVF